MITEQDRSGWFGASDTAYIMGNWTTKTFQKWWLQKLGIDSSHYASRAMNAGTYYEHAILEHIGAERKDHQITIPALLLRVNLDGDAVGKICEVKTHRADKPFRVTKAYWQQVQIQIFAKIHEESSVPVAEIVSYGLVEHDYRNFFNPIAPDRVAHHPVAFDPGFIEGYLPRLRYLGECLQEGVFPHDGADL